MRRRSPNPVWFALLLGTVAAGAMVLSVSPAGHAALDRIIGHEEAVALLPGVTVEDAPSPARGLVVTSLRSDSEAVQAGIAVGDGIAAIDGRPVETLDRARIYLRDDRAAQVVLRLVHKRAARSVTLGRGGEAPHGA